MSLFEILYFPGDKSVLITKPPVVSTTGGFRFFTFFKNAEGFGEQRVPQLESVVGIHFRRGKAEVSRLFSRWNFDFIHLSTRQRLELILSILVDTFFSRISLTMLPVPNPHNTSCVLS